MTASRPDGLVHAHLPSGVDEEPGMGRGMYRSVLVSYSICIGQMSIFTMVEVYSSSPTSFGLSSALSSCHPLMRLHYTVAYLVARCVCSLIRNRGTHDSTTGGGKGYKAGYVTRELQ